MNIFFCKKCDKLNEEKVIKLNISEDMKYNNINYYNNILYNSQKFIKDFKTLPNNNQEDELQIIEYPYEERKESNNNCSKSTLKKYNFDDDNIIEIKCKAKPTSIKEIFYNLHKKKTINRKKNIFLNNDFFMSNNNFDYYFLKKNQKKFIVHNMNNNNKRFSKNKIKLSELNVNKTNNINNSLDQKRNDNIIKKIIPLKKKNSFNYFKMKYNNSSIIKTNTIKKKKESSVLINNIIKKIKTIDSNINKKNNFNKFTITRNNIKKSQSKTYKNDITNKKIIIK